MSVADIYTPELQAYVRDLFGEDPALVRIRTEAARAGLPGIEVGTDEGRFLAVTAAAVGARRVLEIGTLAGYSAAWIAKGLPEDGLVVTIEANPQHAETARRLLDEAGLMGRVQIRVGPALEVLPTLAGPSAFDMVFIDADKAAYPDYLDWALRLSRPGTVILAHNVFRGGEVASTSDAHDVEQVRAFNRRLAEDPRLVATLVPLRDGMSIAVVR